MLPHYTCILVCTFFITKIMAKYNRGSHSYNTAYKQSYHKHHLDAGI